MAECNEPVSFKRQWLAASTAVLLAARTWRDVHPGEQAGAAESALALAVDELEVLCRGQVTPEDVT